jgi:hypothetical protein
MSAYTPGFVAPVDTQETSGQASSILVNISPSRLPVYEPMAAASELVLAGDDEIVMGIAGYIDLSVSVQQAVVSTGTVVADGTQIDSDGEIIPEGEVIPIGTPIVPALYTRQLIAEAGPYALVRTMGTPLDFKSKLWGLNASHQIYDSADNGVNFTLRAPRTVPLGFTNGHTAMNPADGSYVHIDIAAKKRSPTPIMQLTIGKVGQNPVLGAKKWERPYLPIRVEFDGTKFVIFTESNRVYHSTDRVNWTHAGTIGDPVIQFYTDMNSAGFTGGTASILGEVYPKFFWLPRAQIWVLLWSNIYGWYTTDTNAVSGWQRWAPTWDEIVPGSVGVTYTARFFQNESGGDERNKIAGLLEVNANLMYVYGRLEFPNLNPGPFTGYGNYAYDAVFKSVDKGLTWDLVANNSTPADLVSYYRRTAGLVESSPGVYSIVQNAANNLRFFPSPNVYVRYMPAGVPNISDYKYTRIIGDGSLLSGGYPDTVDCLGFD